MKAKFGLYVLGALALTGLGISIYQTYEFFQVRMGAAGFEAFCTVGANADCLAVSASPYAELIFGLPLSAFAAGFYVGFFVLTCFLTNSSWGSDAHRVLTLLSAASVVVSIIYLIIMTTQLGQMCIMCLSIDAINVVSLGILFAVKKDLNGDKPPAPDKEKLRFLVITSATCLAVVLIISKMADPLTGQSENLDLVVKTVVNRPEVVITKSDDYPSIGPKDAPITIVKFSDFQCPACKQGAYSIHPVLNRYPDKVKFVFRNFPLDSSCNPNVRSRLHPLACEAARYAMCAHSQGKFEAMYEKIFENQADLKEGKLDEWAKEVGLDEGQLKACAESQDTKNKISRDIEEGIEVGVESTPTFFINGRRMAGSMPTVVWNEIIDQLLQKK